MTRTRHGVGPAVLAAAAVLVVLAGGCGGPSSVALADLARDHQAYEGERLELHGVVVEFAGDEQANVPRHAVLQDPEAHRVELVPFERAQPHVGSTVRVVGTFQFEPGRGRLLRIDSIEPAGE